jgi:outer membrane receptor protein involved in Fe transport
MAHFALIKDTIVQQVIVVGNADLTNNEGNEQEALGVAFCHSLFGTDGTWMQTSYNGNIRKNFAGIGHTYDLTRDAFIAPNPYASWVLNESTCQWEAPTPYPDDDNNYEWDESTTSWVKVEAPE